MFFEKTILGFAIFLNYAGIVGSVSLYFYVHWIFQSNPDVFNSVLSEDQLLYLQLFVKCVPITFFITMLWSTLLGTKHNFNKELSGNKSKKMSFILGRMNWNFVLPAVLHTLGLIASGFGDAFMELRGSSDHMFLRGVISFAIAHLFFAVGFSIQVSVEHESLSFPGWNFIWLIPVEIFSGVIIFLLSKNEVLVSKSHLFVGFIFYSQIISVMSWRACATPKTCYGLLRILGTLLFILSDSFIALSTFRKDLIPLSQTQSQTIIMSTYWLSHFLMILSNREITNQSNMQFKKIWDHLNR